MRDNGEPISRGQLDRRAAEIKALRDSLFVAAFFGGVVLINGILAILLIEFFQSIGWWEVTIRATSEAMSPEFANPLGGHRLQPTMV
jgi:hypothetical protein